MKQIIFLFALITLASCQKSIDQKTINEYASFCASDSIEIAYEFQYKDDQGEQKKAAVITLKTHPNYNAKHPLLQHKVVDPKTDSVKVVTLDKPLQWQKMKAVKIPSRNPTFAGFITWLDSK